MPLRFSSLLLIVLPLIVLPLIGACSEPKSERCKRVCRLETDCAEARSQEGDTFPYDLDECIAGCVSLERDKSGRAKIDKHVECADQAGADCAKLMECQ